MRQLYESLFIQNRVLYSNLANSHFKEENIQLKRFFESLSRYANSANEAYCSLYGSKNYISMAHLLRMMADACFCAYGLLICNNKEGYLQSFFDGLPLNKHKKGNEQLTSNAIKKYIEPEYVGISKVYEISNKFIHPSGFYYKDYSPEAIINHQGKDLLSDYSSLYNKTEVKLLNDLMQGLNEALYDILKRVKETIEPIPILKDIIDLNTGKIIPNPKYNPDK